MIRDDIAMAAHLFDAVSAHPEMEAVTLSLSIATFRYVPPRGGPIPRAIDDVNREILEQLQKGGEAFVSNAGRGREAGAPRLHRQLPHDEGGRRSAPGDRGTDRGARSR
jgi:hypothetical protein